MRRRFYTLGDRLDDIERDVMVARGIALSGGSGGGGGGSTAWASITGKPSTFPPSSHTHTASEVSGLPAATQVEISLGPNAVRSGRATITDAQITAASKLLVTLAPGPYTDKGTLADEAELMGPITFSASPADGSAVLFWSSPFVQRGNVKVNYLRA